MEKRANPCFYAVILAFPTETSLGAHHPAWVEGVNARDPHGVLVLGIAMWNDRTSRTRSVILESVLSERRTMRPVKVHQKAFMASMWVRLLADKFYLFIFAYRHIERFGISFDLLRDRIHINLNFNFLPPPLRPRRFYWSSHICFPSFSTYLALSNCRNLGS